MKFTHYFIISSLILCCSVFQSQGQTTKNIHKEVHSQLLANAKNSIDKSVIQSYIKSEIEKREQDPVFGDLSEENIALISDLLQEANSHYGKKYRYGAKGPNAFDCSGFTGYVFNQFGYNIGTSSRGQYYEGIDVKKSSLRPGDLVFFTSRRSKGGVGHVGIVVTADNENQTFTFIHASTNSGIKISTSTEAYYAGRYIGARRIIKD
ncbi:MAG: C40 family peptidase [Muribaculaceae bacterium]|nr:C40 family peptidase [Muribaculaceae bacterium]